MKNHETGQEQARVHDRLLGLIARGQEEGVIRRELSSHLLTAYMQGVAEFFSRPEVLARFQDVRFVGEQFRTMFLFGIAAPGAEQSGAKVNGS